MFAIVENEQVTQLLGNENHRFSETVFQPASTLSVEQMTQFGVVDVVEQLDPYDELRFYHDGFIYTSEGGQVVMTYNLKPLQLQHYQAMREGAVERGLTDRVAEIDARIAEL